MNNRGMALKMWRRPALALALNIALGATALAAIAALVLEYGFRGPPPVSKAILHAVETAVVAVFVLDRFVRVLLARRRGDFLRENWVDFLLMFLAAAAVAISFRWQIVSAGALYVVITQAYILAVLILRAVSVNLSFAGSGIHPSWLLLGSFAFLILAGSGLLMLPAATPPDRLINYHDALFTATSGTCVTGLIVRDTGSDFTPFGQAVILVLIQCGGLGIMLFGTVTAMLVGKGLSLRTSNAMGQMLATERIGEIGRVVKFVIATTFTLEAVGAAMLFGMFASACGPGGGPAPTATAVWHSAFHSISSFCNAGFALYGRNMAEGVAAGWQRPLRDHWQIMGVMAPLIVLGGLGFPVLQDCARYIRRLSGGFIRRLRGMPQSRGKSPRARLSLHSKVVLTTSAALVVLGAAALLLVEQPNRPDARLGAHPIFDPRKTAASDWARMPMARRAREALFHSITARTAGFNTVAMTELSNAGKLSLAGLMIIGGSPASTAGGMKTMTFALLVLTAYGIVRRRRELEVFHRSIPLELLRKAVTVAVLYLALVAAVTVLLSVALDKENFIDVLFEACSACGTVGLTTGVTSRLTVFAKYVIIAGMFVGRLGPLTLLVALTSRIRHVEYAYPTENVIIG